MTAETLIASFRRVHGDNFAVTDFLVHLADNIDEATIMQDGKPQRIRDTFDCKQWLLQLAEHSSIKS